MESNREDVIWAAGLIDGEGHIAIVRQGSRKEWGLRLQVTNSDPRAHRSLTAILGGRAYGPYQNKVKGEGSGKPWWSWEMRGRKAADALRHLRPFLRLKGEQADVGLAFAETLTPGGGRYPLSAETNARRIQLSDNLLRIRAEGGS